MNAGNLFYKITEDINDLFCEFTSIKFEINPEKNRVSFDDLLNYESFLFDCQNKLERNIRALYLHGADSFMDRLLQLLLKAKDITSSVNYGIEFKITSKGKDGEPIRIEPEVVKMLMNVKLRYIENLIEYVHGLKNYSISDKTKDISNLRFRPVFSKDSIDSIYNILSEYFNAEHQVLFQKLLNGGEDVEEKLIFLSNGNRLADAFKQLIKANVIKGCEQKELEDWIYRNFKYRSDKDIKDYKPRYLNDIISTNKDLCRNPILDVKIDKATSKIIISPV